MKEFYGKVAVITGAASGIGRAIAQCAAQKGMTLVLADIEKPALDQAAGELRGMGARVLPVRVDVSKPEEVDTLAKRALDAFGAVHLLFNNAGVGAGSTVWGSTIADWQWVIGVNLWGVINGCRAFLPVMLQQGTEGHVVNTASIAGLVHYHPSAPYHVTKHAIVALSENLYYTLAQTKVKVSVVCPGWVQTRIVESERNRPPELTNPPAERPPTPEEMAIMQAMISECQAGIKPEIVAEKVFQGIEQQTLYIFTEERHLPDVRARGEDIASQRNPRLAPL